LGWYFGLFNVAYGFLSGNDNDASSNKKAMFYNFRLVIPFKIRYFCQKPEFLIAKAFFGILATYNY